MIRLINHLLIVLLLFFGNCKTQFFNVIPIADHKNLDKVNIYNFDFYKSKEDIKGKYFEIAVLSTDMHFYGNFFYDEQFMDRLKNEVISLNGNAVLYEKNKKDYKDYNKNFIYFTVIRLIEK